MGKLATSLICQKPPKKPKSVSPSTVNTIDIFPLQMNVEGSSCSNCKSGTFYLSPDNKDGCLSCFCMGVTQQCSSSTYYRDLVRPSFVTTSNTKAHQTFNKLNTRKPTITD